jgi:hypothetical protein
MNFWKFLKINNKGFNTCHFNFAAEESAIKSLHDQADIVRSALNNLNCDLEKKGSLGAEEHKKIRSVADIVASHSEEVKQEEATASIFKDNIAQRDLELAEDEAKFYRMKLHEMEEQPELIPEPKVSQGICNARNVLKNHGGRLSRLESMICGIKGKVGSNQALLTEISSKLSNYNNGIGGETTETMRAVEEATSNKCQPCPMYANTNPVNLLEVERQGYGTLIPKQPYTVSQQGY